MPADRPPHELHWFPFYVNDFTSSPSVQRMTDAEVGRFVRLLTLAWGNGTVEPSLEPDDLEGASPRVRAQFKERGSRLFNVKLSKVWKAQRARHDSAVNRGRKGGQKKAELKLSSSSASSSALAEGVANGVANGKQDAMSYRESTNTLSSSTPPIQGAGALAADAPRPAQEPDEPRTGRMERLAAFLPGALRPRPA